MIKDSKRSHYWNFKAKEKQFNVIAKESFVSKKFRFYVNNKMVSEFKTSEDQKKKGFEFQSDGVYFNLKKTSLNGFTLYINNQEFKQGQVKAQSTL